MHGFWPDLPDPRKGLERAGRVAYGDNPESEYRYGGSGGGVEVEDEGFHLRCGSGEKNIVPVPAGEEGFFSLCTREYLRDCHGLHKAARNRVNLNKLAWPWFDHQEPDATFFICGDWWRTFVFTVDAHELREVL